MVFGNNLSPPSAAKLRATRSSNLDQPLPELFDLPDPEGRPKRKKTKRGGKEENNVPLIFSNSGYFQEMLGILNSIELKPPEEEEDNDEVQIPPQAYEQLYLFFGGLLFQNSFFSKLPGAKKFEENLRKSMIAAQFNANDVNSLRQW